MMRWEWGPTIEFLLSRNGLQAGLPPFLQLAVEFILALAVGSSEEIAFGRDDQIAGRTLPGKIQAAHDRYRNTCGLSLHELRGTGDFVRHRDHRRVQLVACRVALAL